MDNLKEAISYAVGAIFFCLAISILLLFVRNYDATLRNAKKVLQEEVIFEQIMEEPERILTKGELIASLMGEQQYDIEIDGYLISKTIHSELLISTYPITAQQYRKTYVYNENGKITRIVYTAK